MKKFAVIVFEMTNIGTATGIVVGEGAGSKTKAFSF
jgi:hypothetical protein